MMTVSGTAVKPELVARDIDEAERLMLAAIDEQQQMGGVFLGHAKAVLAEIRIAQGRYREALQLANKAKGVRDPMALDDRITGDTLAMWTP